MDAKRSCLLLKKLHLIFPNLKLQRFVEICRKEFRIEAAKSGHSCLSSEILTNDVISFMK